MPDLESLRLGFFKDLRLGDFIPKRPTYRLLHDGFQFQSSTYAGKAHGFAQGPNLRWEIEFNAAFKRGFRGAEGRSAFWDRIIQFGVDLTERMSPKTGHALAGPLAFVRDPEGTRHTNRDETATGLAVSAGSPAQVQANPGVTDSGEWAVGQSILFIDAGNPSTFDWEIATIDAISNHEDFTVDSLSYAKAQGATMYRVERYVLEAFPLDPFEFDGSGSATDGFVKEITFKFGAVLDPVNGALED